MHAFLHSCPEGLEYKLERIKIDLQLYLLLTFSYWFSENMVDNIAWQNGNSEAGFNV
jgi:hypothetical protein